MNTSMAQWKHHCPVCRRYSAPRGLKRCAALAPALAQSTPKRLKPAALHALQEQLKQGSPGEGLPLLESYSAEDVAKASVPAAGQVAMKWFQANKDAPGSTPAAFSSAAAPPLQPLPGPDESHATSDYHEVEAILRHRTAGAGRQYLVKVRVSWHDQHACDSVAPLAVAGMALWRQQLGT